MGSQRALNSRLAAAVSILLFCGAAPARAQEQYSITGYDLPCGRANEETACSLTSAQNLALKAVNELSDAGKKYWKVYSKINSGYSDYFPENTGYYVTCGDAATGKYLAHGLYANMIGQSPQKRISSGDVISQHNYADQVAAITRAGGGWLERTYATANSSKLPYLSRGFYAPHVLPGGNLTYCASSYQTIPATSTSIQCTAGRYTFCSFQVAQNLATVASLSLGKLSVPKLGAALAAITAQQPPFVFPVASGSFYVFVVGYSEATGSQTRATFVAHGLYPSLSGLTLQDSGLSDTETEAMLATARAGGGWVAFRTNGIQTRAFLQPFVGQNRKTYFVAAPFLDPSYEPVADCTAGTDSACAATYAHNLVLKMQILLRSADNASAIYRDINRRLYSKRGFYPFIYDKTGRNLAHGGNSSFVGHTIDAITRLASFQTTPNLQAQILELGSLPAGAWLTYMWTKFQFKRAFLLPNPAQPGSVIGVGFAANTCVKQGRESYIHFDGPCTAEIAYNLAQEASKQLELAQTKAGVSSALNRITDDSILSSRDGCYVYIFESKYEGVQSVDNVIVATGILPPLKKLTLDKTVAQSHLPNVLWWKIKAAAEVGGAWFVHDYRSMESLYFVWVMGSREGAYYVATDMAQSYLTGLPPAPISFQS